MSETPSTTGDNGQRGPGGRFAPGNKLAVGNPHAAHVAALRSSLLAAVTPEKMTAIIEKLIGSALEGNIAAAKEVLERTLGKPIESDLLERLERLEQLISRKEQQ